MLIGLRQRLSQPRHRPVQMLEFQLRRPVDDLVAHPRAGRAIGAGDHDAVKHAGEDRALDVELEAPLRKQRMHDPLAAAGPPQALEGQGGTDAAHLGAVLAVALSGLGGEHHELFGEAACGLEKPVEGAAFLEMIEAAQGCDDALADLLALAVVLDDLDVGVGTADFCATEHACLHGDTTYRVRELRRTQANNRISTTVFAHSVAPRSSRLATGAGWKSPELRAFFNPRSSNQRPNC